METADISDIPVEGMFSKLKKKYGIDDAIKRKDPKVEYAVSIEENNNLLDNFKTEYKKFQKNKSSLTEMDEQAMGDAKRYISYLEERAKYLKTQIKESDKLPEKKIAHDQLYWNFFGDFVSHAETSLNHIKDLTKLL